MVSVQDIKQEISQLPFFTLASNAAGIRHGLCVLFGSDGPVRLTFSALQPTVQGLTPLPYPGRDPGSGR